MRARAPIPGLEAGERQLDPATAHYLTRVLRLRVGDTFEAFDPQGGGLAEGSLVVVDGDRVRVMLGAPKRSARDDEAPLVWVQGLAKGDKCDAIVRDVTELGATRFVAAQTARAVVRLDAARAEARVVRFRRIAAEAARQCERASSPEVSVGSWTEALGAAPRHAHARRFVLYERATVPLGGLLLEALRARAPLAFAVGPEGGLTEQEIEEAQASGWESVSLGPRILRTETVAAAVLGAVRVLGGAFGQ